MAKALNYIVEGGGTPHILSCLGGTIGMGEKIYSEGGGHPTCFVDGGNNWGGDTGTLHNIERKSLTVGGGGGQS